MPQQKKHLFFDLDDTITASRQLIEDDVLQMYRALPCDVVVISGAHADQIERQVRDLECFRLGQNGNQARSPYGAPLWEDVLSPEQEERIYEHVASLRRKTTNTVADPEDLVEGRGAQISYSMIGHHADHALKRAFDPTSKRRLQLLEEVPFTDPELEVKVGGTTTFDYFKKGKNKGYNVKKLIASMGWDPDDAVYFGDALFPGGNDETVMGVIETVPVKNHRETRDILKSWFS